jgi:hypothetical protein
LRIEFLLKSGRESSRDNGLTERNERSLEKIMRIAAGKVSQLVAIVTKPLRAAAQFAE